MKVSSEDHAKIAAAVARAEAFTSGEIRCVLALESSDGERAALFWAAMAALLAPALALLLGFRPEALTRLFGGWSAAQLAARDGEVLAALVTYIALQSVVFLAAWLIASWKSLRRALTPKAVLSRRVHEAALEQFGALGLHRTRDRTGVLLYASLAEHKAEVLADEGIYAKAPPAVWDEVVQLLVAGLRRGEPAEGFVAAVERTGDILKATLPPRGDDLNELPNQLLQRE